MKKLILIAVHLLLVKQLAFFGLQMHAQTTIVDPEWVFEDDFEGAESADFWLGGASNTYGGACTSDAGYEGKVLRFNYPINVGGNSFSEKRFKLPASEQVEMSYDLFVPANYVRSEANHKNFSFWSGDYSVVGSNIAMLSESWPVDAGGHPSLYIGEDGNNYGHSGVAGGKGKVIYPNNSGSWHKISVYLELAKEEGDYGVMEIWRDGELLVATHMEEVSAKYGKPPVDQHIAYSSRGNFLDQGYLLGWSNGGFSEETVFCIDNFSMKTRSTVGESASIYRPSPPVDISIQKN